MPNDIQVPRVAAGDGEATGNETVGRQATQTDARTIHRGRKLFDRADWRWSDAATILGLILLLPPAWFLPERSWYPLWRCLARFPVLTSARAARRTGATIADALGDIDRKTGERIARDLKACVYEMRLQDLRGWRPALLGGAWRPRMRLEGEGHLQAALSGGKGAVLWLAPFVFNSGPTKFAIHAAGYRVSHLSSPHHGYSETRFGIAWLNKIRCVPEDRHIAERVTYDREAPASAMRRLMRAVKGGNIATIVAASTEGTEIVKAPIFGGLLPVAVGAPRLAGLTGAPLLPVFTVRDPVLGYRVVIEAPLARPADLSGGQQIVAAATEFLRRSDPWVRKYPEQWRAWSKWRS